MTAASAPASCPAGTEPGPEPVREPVAEPGRPARRPGPLACLPGVAGTAYLAAWIAGLAAWPSNLALNATAAQVTTAHAARAAQAVTQYLLVEGLAGLLLGTVLGCALLPRLRRGFAPRLNAGAAALRPAVAALLTVAAVVISLAQCVLGLLLTSAATGHEAGRAGDLFGWVNHLDGVKMLAIAGAAVLLALSGAPAAALPRWLRVVTVPLALALLASGCAYLAQAQPLAWVVYVSGPLLLLWVTGAGVALTARRKQLPLT